jgi:hypothetical protein
VNDEMLHSCGISVFTPEETLMFATSRRLLDELTPLTDAELNTQSERHSRSKREFSRSVCKVLLDELLRRRKASIRSYE